MTGSHSTDTSSIQHDDAQRSIDPTLVNASTHTSVIACSLYLEELKVEYDLQALDECPACHVIVARHQRQPLSLDVNTSNNSPQALNHSTSSLRSVNVAKAFRNLKSSHVLPVWKSSAVC